MTVRDDVARLLQSAPEGMTDAELARALGKLHAQVNLRCRQLVDLGLVVRDRSQGVIVNRWVGGAGDVVAPLKSDDPRPASPRPAPEGHATEEWSWEGNVQSAVVSHLAREGWRVTRVADTASQERGVDVTAERDGRRLLIEVKGWPSTTYVRGDKAGQPKPTRPTLQAKHWYAEALLTALRLRERHVDDAVVIALPDMPRYRSLLAETASSLASCRVSAWLIEESGEVSTL